MESIEINWFFSFIIGIAASIFGGIIVIQFNNWQQARNIKIQEKNREKLLRRKKRLEELKQNPDKRWLSLFGQLFGVLLFLSIATFLTTAATSTPSMALPAQLMGLFSSFGAMSIAYLALNEIVELREFEETIKRIEELLGDERDA